MFNRQPTNGLAAKPAGARPLARTRLDVGRIALNNGVYISILLLCIVFGVLSSHFLTISNLRSVLIQSAVVAITGGGLTVVIITAGIDISVGSMLFFAGALGMLPTRYGASPWMTFPAILTVGVIAGAFNGALVTKLRLVPLIATLAMFGVYKGIANILLGVEGRFMVPSQYKFLIGGTIGHIPVPIIVTAVVLGLGQLILSKTQFGRQVYAVGNDAAKARSVGIPVNRVLFLSYVFAGACVGVAALMWNANMMIVTSGMGNNLEFSAITAAVLGGASLFGGEGRILPGTWFGALVVVIINNGLNLMNVSPFYYGVVTGLVILFAILADSFKHIRG